MSVVIQVENLSKYYRLGLIGGGTLREDLNRWWAKARGRPDPLLKIGETDHGNRVGGELWALRDVSFQVREGEILGIIGRNGAGKSTLLKILSRITAPTSGQVKIKGRVGSLLEVGTGFHPELTGRENIYLNGAILGMKKAEIDRKLDEIIDFAEIEQFIDTPVKRYSSGMYVRLAFAVAAHLEPEILIVDEVLAVGDAAFQKKCLGKMGDVANSGLTVLFVSHNMPSIRVLCERVILLNAGSIKIDDRADAVISNYMSLNISNTQDDQADVNVSNYSRGAHSKEPAIKRVWMLNDAGAMTNNFAIGSGIDIRFELEPSKKIHNLGFGFSVEDDEGRRIFSLNNYMLEIQKYPELSDSKVVGFRLKSLPLLPGTYYVSISLVENERFWIDFVERAIKFTIYATDIYGTGRIPERSHGFVYVNGAVSYFKHSEARQ